MSQPAAVLGDPVVGSCAIHQIPNPASGVPQPAPPMPFNAPLTQGLATSVLIMNKPAAVMGSSGVNTPPHVGLHPSDPSMLPAAQQGRVVAGSQSVLFEGKPAAHTGCQVSMCAAAPGQLTGSGASVLIGA